MYKIRKAKKDNCLEIDLKLRKLLSGRKLKQAENLARKNVKEFNDPESFYGLALTLATVGFLKNINSKKKKAQQYYRKIISKFPGTMHAYLSQARIKEESYKLKEALPFYKKAFKKYPTTLNAIHIANIYKQLNKAPLAKKYYSIAEKIKKTNLIILNN